MLRTIGPDAGERHASWLELFFDLVFVVAIAQLSHLFVGHPDWAGALIAGGLFLPVFLAWQGFFAFADRFDTDDLPFRLAAFAQMFALLALCVQMRDVATGSHAGFAITFAILRAILVALYARAYRHAPVARPLIRRYASAYAISVILWLVAAAVSTQWALAIGLSAVLLDLSMPPLSTRLHRSIPTDPSHLPERFGLFTLIVLGELIVAVSISTLEATWSAAVVGAAVMSFGIASCLWWIYFERLTEQSLPRSAGPVVTYAYAHLPLVAALMFVASGVSLLIRSEGGPAGAWALCSGVGSFLFAVSVAHAQLVAPPSPFVLRARRLAALVVVAIPFMTQTPVTISTMTLGVLVTLVVFEALTCGPEERAGERSVSHG